MHYAVARQYRSFDSGSVERSGETYRPLAYAQDDGFRYLMSWFAIALPRTLQARYQVTMELSDGPPPALRSRWTSLWAVALVSLLVQLWLCQFFTFGEKVPVSIDVNPSNLWKFAYHVPPIGTFQTLNWLGVPYPANSLSPLSLAVANDSAWLFFTSYMPIVATFALLAMAAFLRELELPRPAALFGGVVFAWQGDLLSFIYPGHFGYITSWPFFAVGAWAALRAERTGHWAYPVISGACCGIMVGLLTNADRGAIASLLIAALYLAAIFRRSTAGRKLGGYLTDLRPLVLCVGVAALIALAPLLALFQSYIVGVKMAGTTDREQTYKLVTQYSLGPAETLTYLVPGFFGWHSNHQDGPYWGWIGEWPDWAKNQEGTANLNLAISTTGTVATALALIGIALLLSGKASGPGVLTERQRFYGRVLLGLGFVTLILAWGWHTPFYRPLFALPLMDKWRNPLKWLEMTNFALVTLSAMGMQYLLTSLDAAAPETKAVRSRLVWFINSLLVLLCLGWAASFPLSILLTARFKAQGVDPGAIAAMMSTMHTSVIVAILMMALFALVMRALWQPEKLRGLTLVNPWLHRWWQKMLEPGHVPMTLALALALLAAVQLGWVAHQFIEPASLAGLTESNPLLEELSSEGNRMRVSVATDDPVLNSLLQNQFAAMRIASLDISAASRIPDDLNTFFEQFRNDQERLWFLAGVKNVVVPEPSLSRLRQDAAIAANIDHVDGYTLERTSSPDLPSHALVVMKDFMAKATLVPKAEYFAASEDDALLKRLTDPAWNPRASVLITNARQEREVEPLAGAGNIPADQVYLQTYTTNEIEVKVQSTLGCFLLVNDQYDPDWQVQVNGQDAELLRADYILRAVRVPPGSSTVTMRYVEHYRTHGLSLNAEAVNDLSDGAMLAAWLIAGFTLWRRKSTANA